MTAAQVLELARAQKMRCLVRPKGKRVKGAYFAKECPGIESRAHVVFFNSPRLPMFVRKSLAGGATPASLGLEVGE